MIDYPRLAFVDKPAASARVRLDLHTFGEIADEQMWPGHDGFTLGAPSFEGGPGAVSAEYGYRRATFGIVVRGTKLAATNAMSALARELLRDGGNWLSFQLSPGSPQLWLRTWQTGPSALSFEQLLTATDGSTDHWGIEVALDCDAFAYGERVTLAPITITNSPVTGTNKMLTRLPEIKGDAPTPLRIYAPGVLTALNGVQISSVAFDPTAPSAPGSSTTAADAYTAPLLIDGFSGWTLGADTTVGGADASFVNSSHHVVSFATNANLATRLSSNTATAPIASTHLHSGRFKAMLRVRINNTWTAGYDLRIGQKTDTDYYWNDTVHIVGSGPGNRYLWVDLGDIRIPFGNPMTPDLAATYLADEAALAIQAGGGASSSSLYIDSLMLIPVDLTALGTSSATSVLIDRGQGLGAAGDAMWFDGETESASLVTLSGSTVLTNMVASPTVAGSFPVGVPGRANFLHYFRSVRSDGLTETTDLTVSYRPRWLWLAAV